MRFRSLLAMASACAAAACSSSPHVSLSAGAPSPVGTFTATQASLPVGVVLAFRASVDGSDGKNGGVTASVDDPTRASVSPTTTAGQFVLMGLAAGKTTLRVRANGAEAGAVPVDVSAQTPSSALLGTPPGRDAGGGTLGVACASGTPISPSFECTSAASCPLHQVCCVVSAAGGVATSACMFACPPSGPMPHQLCSSAAECGDTGVCAPPSIPGLTMPPGLMTCAVPTDDAGP